MVTGQTMRVGALTDPAKNLGAAIEHFLTYCQAKNLSGNTLIYYRQRLEAFRSFVESQGLDAETSAVSRTLIRNFVRSELDANSPSTANHAITALRAFFGFLMREGYLPENPMVGVEKVKTKRPLIEAFTPEQIKAVLATCRNDFLGIRDRAVILTLFDAGLRVSELCNLHLDDVSLHEARLKVLGKGNRERVVAFGQATKQALAQYRARRGELDSKAFFVSQYGRPLDRFRIAKMIKSRCRKAGVTGVRCSPHTLRHTFAISYLRNGGDLFSLQKLLGHSSLDMTRRYTEVSQTDALERHRLCSPADRLNLPERDKGRRRRLV